MFAKIKAISIGRDKIWNLNCDPWKYIMNQPNFIISNWMGESIHLEWVEHLNSLIKSYVLSTLVTGKGKYGKIGGRL